jgi:hypothetical protein
MAVTVPGAELQLQNPISTRPITILLWIYLHTIAGTVAGALSGRHYHIYVRGDGSFVQRQDLLLRSAASVEANPYSIAIVCEDMGPAFPSWSGSNVPRYTPQQVDTLILIISWICHRFGLPTTAVRTSCLNTGKGIAWHRLGIDGAFPPNWPYWGRQPGCLETSLSTGKPCPGTNRITQIVNEIVPAVSSPEEDMPTADEVATAVWNKRIQGADWTGMDAAAKLVMGDIFWHARTTFKLVSNPAALAAGIAAELPDDITAEQVEAALRKVLGSLDESTG